MVDASHELRCVSVHSVKGGVGKSTVALAVARRLAQNGPCLLVDMDLTGTSLADVLVLEPPQAAKEMPEKPPGFLSSGDAHRLIEERTVSAASEGSVRPLFLNDFLLFEQDRFDAERDLHPLAVTWREPDTRLLVMPSSALPEDLMRILPVVYDELHAGFFEGRVEWLLNHLIERTDVRTVVFDTPPSIPGLSAALLSAAARLPRRLHLAPDFPETSPRRLFNTTTRWAPLIVVSSDHQDLRSAERWLVDKSEDELRSLRVVLNSANAEDLPALRYALHSFGQEAAVPPVFSPYGGPLLAGDRVVVLPRTERLYTFRPGLGGAREPDGVDELVAAVEAAWAAS